MQKLSASNNQSLPPSSSFEKVRGQNEYSIKSMILSKLFMLLAVIMIFFTTMLSLSLLQIIPEIKIDTALVIKGNKSNDIVMVEPYAQEMVSEEEMMEMFVRKYVQARHSMSTDVVEQGRYWQPGGVVWFLSTPSIYSKFARKIGPLWDEVKRKTKTIEVEIMGIQRQGKTAFWLVDFKLNEIDTQKLGMTTRYMTASVGCRHREKDVIYTRRMINPLGFKVFEYNAADVKVEEN